MKTKCNRCRRIEEYDENDGEPTWCDVCNAIESARGQSQKSGRWEGVRLGILVARIEELERMLGIEL